jgi:glycosyltransferase involved in cell wall biosynthesis
MKPLRILIASQIYSDGNGQGGFTLRLAENLVKQGYQVKVLMPSDRLKSYSVTVNGVEVEKIAAIHMSMLHPAIYITPLPMPDVKRIFQDFAPDIVHIQDHYFLCQAVASEAHRRSLPLVGTNHFLPENIIPFFVGHPRLYNLAGRILWKMMSRVFNKTDAVTTPSHAAAKILRQQDIHFPVHVISNGVDTGHFNSNSKADRQDIRRKYNLAPGKTIFLYVGRLDGEKRVDILLQAASGLSQTNFQLAIVGGGIKAQALQHQAHHLGLDECVIFLGYVPAADLQALYVSADIFVMPSPAELQSIATLEAISCGKPALVANARALPELVAHGVNGYLFEADNPIDATRWMNKLLETPEQWAKMGQAGIQHSKLHSLNNTILAYEEFYRMVVVEKQAEIRKWSVFKGLNMFEAFRLKKNIES